MSSIKYSLLNALRFFNTDIIGVMSENLKFIGTAGQENCAKAYTIEVVREELIEYYKYHPDGIEGYPTITGELVNLMWEKKRRIRERKSNIVDSVSKFT